MFPSGFKVMDPERGAFAAKSARRRELARLPIEEKVRIVALLQRQENEIRRATGRPLMPEWPIPSERESQQPNNPSLTPGTSDGAITVLAGYAWDGCTPKFNFFDVLSGTPDGVVDTRTGRSKTGYVRRGLGL